MSQIYTTTESSPDVPTSFVTDDGTAIPVANTLNILARDTQADNDNGIQTVADPAGGQNLYVELTNRVQVGASTIGAGNTDITLVDFSIAPFSGGAGTYTFEFRVAAYESTNPAGAVYKIYGGVISDGTTPTLIGTPDKIIMEDAALFGSDANLVVSGNELVLRVTGLAGLTIQWDTVGNYTRSL